MLSMEYTIPQWDNNSVIKDKVLFLLKNKGERDKDRDRETVENMDTVDNHR